MAVARPAHTCTVGDKRYHTPLWTDFQIRFVHSRKSGGAENGGVQAVCLVESVPNTNRFIYKSRGEIEL